MRRLSPAAIGLVVAAVLVSPGSAQQETPWRAVALDAARQALDSRDPRIVAHGIDALAALREPDIARIGAAYRRFRHSEDVRSSTIDALAALRSRPDEAVPVLIDLLGYVTNPANKDPNASSSQDQAPFVQRALASYGEQAVLALPALIALFVAETGPFRHLDTELPRSIAAIGLRTEADVDAIVRAYTTPDPPSRDALDALNGVPRAQRARVAELFLPLTHLREGNRATALAAQSVRALGVLAIESPAVIDRLETIIASGDAALLAEAASSLGAVLAANPTVAPDVLRRRIYDQNQDLVDVVARLAGEEGPPDSLYPFNGETSTSMRTLARLSQVSPRALEMLTSFVEGRRPATNAPATTMEQGLAIAAVPWAGEHAAALVLAALRPGGFSGGSPVPSSRAREDDTARADDPEVILARQLANTLSRLGSRLAPAFPRFVRALNASNTVNQRRLLSWAILRMVDGPVPFHGEILTVLQRTTDWEARGYLLAAFVRGGGDPTRVIDDVKQSLSERSLDRTDLYSYTWEGSGDSELFDAVVRRSDFNWNAHSSGAAILELLIDARNRDDTFVHDPVDLVPFGPLSLSQALLLMEGRADDAHYLEDPSFWAPFLAPAHRGELALAEQHLIGEPPDLPNDLEGLRVRMATLTRILQACSPAWRIQHKVAPALTLLYGRGVGQWTGDDERLLADAAAALERVAAAPAAAIRHLDEDERGAAARVRSDAARNARVLRDRIEAERQRLEEIAQRVAAEDSRAKAVDRATTVERDTAALLQTGERARRRAVFASLGLGGALLAGSIVVLSASVRRRILILAGRRWSFVTAPCDGTLEVGASAIFRPTASPRPVVAAVPADPWPPPAATVAVLRAGFQPGWNIRVLVDEAQFRRPWSHLVGSPWSEGAHAVVAGQLCVAAPEAFPPAPLAKSVVFAAYACATAPDEEPLAGVDAEVRTVERLFRRWGAISRAVSQASIRDVTEGLATADVVHVAAHASGAAIHLRDGLLDVERLRGLEGPLRCRLLVLSCCQAARIEEDQSFVYHLVRAGVNVLAARNPVDDQACVEFFEAFYGALLPARRAQGIDLGTCIRRAADTCAARFRREDDGAVRGQEYADWKDTVDSFMLYGDPSTQLKLIADGGRRGAP